MEISLVDEQAYHFVPQVSVEIAHDRVEQKKTQLVGGPLGGLFSRLKPEEVQLLGVENRLESFWLITVSSRTVYDRAGTQTVPVQGSEVKSVTVLEHDLAVEPKDKGGFFTLNIMEHCKEEARATRAFSGLQGEPADPAKYAAFAKTLIADLNSFAPQGVLVVPPQVRATAVVRQVMSEVIRPVSNAQVILEERVDVETVELNFRPVYAFEYEIVGKGKRSIIEFNALTGEINAGGRKFQDQIKGMLTRDLLFDITADAVGMFVPGGSIAVKLVKAVVDRK